jgi:hypothetical protein
LSFSFAVERTAKENPSAATLQKMLNCDFVWDKIKTYIARRA